MTPSTAASAKVALTAAMAAAVQVSPSTVCNSGQPQLMETTEGALAASWMAVETTSTQPCSVQGAK